MTDQRHFHRVGHDARATLSLGQQIWPCVVQDLSLRGCLVELTRPETLAPGEVYHLGIHLSYSIHIEMDVEPVRQDGPHVGLQCLRIDADSIAQLRRLIELNTGDSRLLEREIRELIRV